MPLVAEEICQPLLAFERPDKGTFPIPGVSQHQRLDLGQCQWDPNWRSLDSPPLCISYPLHPQRSQLGVGVHSGRWWEGGVKETRLEGQLCWGRLFTYKLRHFLLLTHACLWASAHECEGFHVCSRGSGKTGPLETGAHFSVREVGRGREGRKGVVPVLPKCLPRQSPKPYWSLAAAGAWYSGPGVLFWKRSFISGPVLGSPGSLEGPGQCGASK